MRTLYLGVTQPLYRLSDDETLSLNYQVLNNRRPHDARFEECFEELNGMSIWDKIFVLMLDEFDIPLKSIHMIAKESECASYEVWYDRGSARFRESGCTAGISAKRPVKIPSPEVASAAVGDAATQTVDVAEIEAIAKLQDATVTLLEEDDDHITLVIRGIRNQVIVGSNYWEKLTINIFLWRNFLTTYNGGTAVQRGFHTLSESEKPWGVKESLQIRVITEGSYAAGSGTYPKDEYFTQNMEPEFHSQLTEFANKLVGEISDIKNGASP